MGHAERPEDVDAVDEVPVLLRHLVKARVAQDARVVHHDVHAAEGVEGVLDDAPALLHRLVVGHRLAARVDDLLDHLICGLAGAAAAGHRPTQIVHHHPGAPAREQERVRPPQPVPRPGDDGHPPLESQLVSHQGLWYPTIDSRVKGGRRVVQVAEIS